MSWALVLRKVVHRVLRENGSLKTRRSEGSCGQLSARAGAGWFAFLGAGVSGGKCDVIGAISAIAGMLLCVGCLVSKAYPTGF